MSTEQTTDTTVTDNLDDFASTFFGEDGEPSDNAKSETEEAVKETDSDAPTDEQDTHSADDGATEEEAEAEPEDEPTDDDGAKAKPKNRYQERINELTAKARQAERERDELLRKLEEKNNPPKADPKPEAKTEPSEGPSPTDKNEDGTDKYPLGEFDPKFVKDTVQHMLNEQLREQAKQQQEQQKLSAEEQYRATLTDTWNEKLEVVQERYPDYQEKGEQMLAVFEGIDPAYGQYLTDTLMEMDAGPEVFYYLSNNLDKAQEIVNAGPRKATIALAKIEAQLAGETPTQAPKVKVTKAPTPPPQLKGSAISKASIPLDTDDLDAFSKALFTKK
jgi:hypothetical protein